MKIVQFILALLVTCTSVNGEVKGFKLSYEKDSFQIGSVLEIKLSLIHDEEYSLYFPDANSDFGDFDFVSKHTIPSTYTEDSLILDQAVYQLRSFAIEDSIPLFIDIKELSQD